jgi:membrane associated rhomboid family serine protease
VDVNLTAIVVACVLAGLLTARSRPVSADLRPRVAFELAVIAAAGMLGALVSDLNGTLIASCGTLPAIAHQWAIRRAGPARVRGDAASFARAVRVLDVMSWPVPDQALNIWFHRDVADVGGDEAVWGEFLARRRRRPTSALVLARAEHAGDEAEVRRAAAVLLGRTRPPIDQAMGFGALAKIDLPLALRWYRSKDSLAARRAVPTSLHSSALIAGGRPDAAVAIAQRIGLTADVVAATRANASLAAGVEPAIALAPLDEHGPRGAAAKRRLASSGRRPQVLDADDVALIDQMAADSLPAVAIFGADVGGWRPRLVWFVGGVLVLGFLRQVWHGPITVASLLDLGAYIAGPNADPWRALTAPYLHANAAHLAMNVFGLLIVGRHVEARVSKLQFLAIWVAASSGAFLIPGALSGHLIAVGASGGVMGLLGASISLFGLVAVRYRQANAWMAVRSFAAVALLQVVVDLFLPFVAGGAHLAGLGIGMVMGALFGWHASRCAAPPSENRRDAVTGAA